MLLRRARILATAAPVLAWSRPGGMHHMAAPRTSRFLMTAVKPAISLDKERNGLITIAPGDGGAAHTATFIGPIHGLGDTNMGWADAALQMHTNKLPHVKFMLPNAPVQPVTLNMGMSMPSWYDITSLDDRANQECEGIEDARSLVNSMIATELAAGIPLERIVVGGFSQGGAVALYAGLQYAGTLGGICCMSGYLPKDHAFKLAPEAAKTPVAHFHGLDDPTVKFEWARARCLIELRRVAPSSCACARGVATPCGRQLSLSSVL